MDPLDILVVADLHYTNRADRPCRHAVRRGELGRILLRKAVHRLHHLGGKPGLIVLLGDAVDNGRAPGADADLAELAETLKAMKVPVLAVRGNHDGDTGAFESIFNKPGLHEIGGYGFLVFNDAVAEGDVTTRQATDLALVDRIVAERPDLPLVVLQHNPMDPRVGDDGTYPYMLTNNDAALDGYDRAKVVLSLSGHYHPGQTAHRRGEVVFCTAPALCEAPFRFLHVRLQGREVQVQEHRLALDAPGPLTQYLRETGKLIRVA